MGQSKVKPSPSSSLTDGQHLGAYRIVRLLGEGGMGAVYEARQEPLDRRVALKTLHADYAKSQDAVARFFNEAKVLSRLEHPSIVQVSDFGITDDGTAYLVMEYLRGQSLGRRIRTLGEQGERLSLLSALQLCFQIADVLAVAHAQGIVHRDAYVISKVCFHVGHLGPQRRRNKPCPLTVPAAARSALTSY